MKFAVSFFVTAVLLFSTGEYLESSAESKWENKTMRFGYSVEYYDQNGNSFSEPGIKSQIRVGKLLKTLSFVSAGVGALALILTTGRGKAHALSAPPAGPQPVPVPLLSQAQIAARTLSEPIPQLLVDPEQTAVEPAILSALTAASSASENTNLPSFEDDVRHPVLQRAGAAVSSLRRLPVLASMAGWVLLIAAAVVWLAGARDPFSRWPAAALLFPAGLVAGFKMWKTSVLFLSASVAFHGAFILQEARPRGTDGLSGSGFQTAIKPLAGSTARQDHEPPAPHADVPPSPPTPPPATSKDLAAAIEDFDQGGIANDVVVTTAAGKKVLVASLSQPLSVEFGPEERYLAVREKENTQRRIVRIYRQTSPLRFEEMPTSHFYGALPTEAAMATLRRMDLSYEDCYADIDGWEASDKIRLSIYCRTRGKYSLTNYKLVLNLATLTKTRAEYRWPAEGQPAAKLVRYSPDGSEELMEIPASGAPLDENKLPAGTKVIPLSPEMAALLNPGHKDHPTNPGPGTSPLPNPEVTGVDAAPAKSVADFINRHYRLASERRVAEQVADYDDTVMLGSLDGDIVQEVKNRKELLAEELKDDKEYFSVHQELASPISLTPHSNKGRIRACFVLSIDNTLAGNRRPVAKKKVRIGLILAPFGKGWKIEQRFTSAYNP